jgi:transcriptional regulator with XRE-family HTH domain
MVNEKSMKFFIEDFVFEILRARKKIPMTQEELASRAGVSKATISRLETFEAIPDLKTMFQLAEALNLKLIIKVER